MAIGTPTERYAQHRTAQGATTTLSPTGTIVVGSFLILASGAAKIISSVADDSGGNTWAVDRAFLSGASRGFSFASMQVETQLTTGSVITITWADATSLAVQIWLQEITGIATSSAFDTSATGSGTGTAVSTSSTGTLAQADEIVFGGFRTQNVSTWTKGGTYTDVSTPLLNGQSSLEYKIVADTTGVLADGTFSVSGTWGGVVATYKGAADQTLYTGYRRLVGPQALATSAATLATISAGTRYDIRHVHVHNPTAGEIEFTLSIGTDAGATRIFDQHPVAAGDSYDANVFHSLAAGESLQGFSDTSGIVIVVDGYQEVV